MAGSKVSNFAIGDSNIQSVMLTLDKTFKGQHQVSLTNYDTTAESQVAAGSVIEIGGALYKFDSNESITGTPSDGTVYIMAVPSGDSVTCAYTNTAPTWSDSKQGWYGTGATANNRYLEFVLIKTASAWQKIIMTNAFGGQTHIKSYVVASGLSPASSKLTATSSIDLLGEFNNSTYEFSPKKSGLYLVTGNVSSRLSDFGTILASLNGTPTSMGVLGFMTSPSVYVPRVDFSKVFYLTQGASYYLAAVVTGITVDLSHTVTYTRIGEVLL